MIIVVIIIVSVAFSTRPRRSGIERRRIRSFLNKRIRTLQQLKQEMKATGRGLPQTCVAIGQQWIVRRHLLSTC
jgi:hypothetical protein